LLVIRITSRGAEILTGSGLVVCAGAGLEQYGQNAPYWPIERGMNSLPHLAHETVVSCRDSSVSFMRLFYPGRFLKSGMPAASTSTTRIRGDRLAQSLLEQLQAQQLAVRNLEKPVLLSLFAIRYNGPYEQEA
jgi:hypothetical protein